MPVPLYFNMANGSDLKFVISQLNSILKVELKILGGNLSKHKVHLYIDSFDEGIGSKD